MQAGTQQRFNILLNLLLDRTPELLRNVVERVVRAGERGDDHASAVLGRPHDQQILERGGPDFLGFDRGVGPLRLAVFATEQFVPQLVRVFDAENGELSLGLAGDGCFDLDVDDAQPAVEHIPLEVDVLNSLDRYRTNLALEDSRADDQAIAIETVAQRDVARQG